MIINFTHTSFYNKYHRYHTLKQKSNSYHNPDSYARYHIPNIRLYTRNRGHPLFIPNPPLPKKIQRQDRQNCVRKLSNEKSYVASSCYLYSCWIVLR